MVDIAREPVIAPRLPLRAVGLGLLLLALILAAIAAIAIGSRPKLPAPFGPAANGLVAYSKNGDIFVADSVSGQERAVVTGPELDVNPIWSRDGTLITFERKATTADGPGSILVVRADGSQPVTVTTELLGDIGLVGFSPDGRRLLFDATVDGVPSILIGAVDGSGVRKLDVGRPAAAWAWRPPLGDEILFVDNYGRDDIGLYAIHPDGGPIRTILPAISGRYRGGQTWSPDGSRIAYGEWTDSGGINILTHIISADGTGDRPLALPSGAVWEWPVAWSNDGSRLLSIRGHDGGYGTTQPVARPVDGTDTGIEIAYPGAVNGACCTAWEWAPDDFSILGTPTDATGAPLQQVMLDPKMGTIRAVPWTTTSPPTWQRLPRTE
jgi:Tol biopolymer transport system component